MKTVGFHFVEKTRNRMTGFIVIGERSSIFNNYISVYNFKKGRRDMSLIRITTILWACSMLVAGCTASAHAFLYEQHISFSLNNAPDYLDLWITSDIHLTKEFYVIQKIGHIMAFGFLYFLVLQSTKKVGISLLVCGCFAFLTEVLQLHFNRNGRLFDVGVDILGILIAFVLSQALKTIRVAEKSSCNP